MTALVHFEAVRHRVVGRIGWEEDGIEVERREDGIDLTLDVGDPSLLSSLVRTWGRLRCQLVGVGLALWQV